MWGGGGEHCPQCMVRSTRGPDRWAGHLHAGGLHMHPHTPARASPREVVVDGLHRAHVVVQDDLARRGALAQHHRHARKAQPACTCT